jgi:hypothetical protein
VLDQGQPGAPAVVGRGVVATDHFIDEPQQPGTLSRD